MAGNLGVHIELVIDQQQRRDLPAAYLAAALTAMNDAAFRSETEELADVRRAFPSLPAVALDAASHRIKEYRGAATQIRSVRSGSIVLEAVLSGLTLWIIQQTLGETLKEAWLEGDAHKNLKTFLTKHRLSKVERLANDMRKRLEKSLPCEVSVRHGLGNPGEADVPATIGIHVQVLPTTKLPPAREDALPENADDLSAREEEAEEAEPDWRDDEPQERPRKA